MLETFLIVLIIVISILLLYFLIRNANYKRYTLSGGDMSQIPQSVKRLIPVGKWPQVNVISNQILQSHGLKAFVWSEKTDGLHMNVGIWANKVFNITNTREPLIPLDFGVRYSGEAILDCELYDEKLYIFDSPLIDGENISSLSFTERLEKVESIINDLGPNFTIKSFKRIKSVADLNDFIKNDISPETGNEIDGVILQLINPPYFSKSATSFKLKPRYLHTVDFRLKYVPEERVFYLYLIGSFRDFLYNLQRRPKDNRYHKFHTGVDTHRNKSKNNSPLPESMEILFSSPLFPDLYFYENSHAWNSEGYSKRHQTDASMLIRDITIDPSRFDGLIVEMSLNMDNKWIPLRIRDDKSTPNGYSIGLSNVAQIFDPLVEPDENYFAKSSELTGANSEIQTIIHKVNSIYRQFIAESLINPLGGTINAIDLCGGRGADEINLYANGVVNLFVIDSDRTALHQYMDRSLFLRKRFDYKPLLESYKDRVHEYGKSGNLFYLNILNHTLGSNYSNITTDLMTRYEWNNLVKIRRDMSRNDNHRMQLVLMNFAIHYLCNKKANLSALSTFISNVLTDNGIFIFTYYDGDSILKLVDSSSMIAKIGPFTIKIVKDTRDLVIAKMPLPTIQAGSDFYREEPLVTSKALSTLEINLATIDDFSLYERSFQFISQELLGNPVIEYLKLVRCRVMKSRNR